MFQVKKGIHLDRVILVGEGSEGFVDGEAHFEEGRVELGDEEDGLEVGLSFFDL